MKKSKSSFRDKIRSDVDRQKKAASSYGYLILPKDVNVFKEEPGSKNILLDFLPYEVTDAKHPDRNDEQDIATQNSLWYKRPFKIHRNIGVDNDSVVCPTSFGKKCPICEYRTKQMNLGASKEETDPLKASLRVLYVVVPIGHKKLDEVPHIWDISQYNFQNLLNEELEENDEYLIFPDLEEGLTLKIRFDSKTIGKGNAFAQASRIDFEDRKEPYDETILDDVPNLDKVLKVLTYKELEVMFMELDDEDVSDDEEAEESKQSSRKKKTTEDETEYEKPRGGSKKAKPEDDDKDDKDNDEEKLTWEDLEGLNESKLIRLIKTKKLDVDADEYDDDVTSLRKAIAKELDIDIPKKKEEKPTSSMKRSRLTEQDDKKSKKSSEEECPNDHAFGDDWDEYSDCDDCKLFDACKKANK